MIGAHFLHNGRLRPCSEALIPLDDVNFAYGYGVYETLKLRAGVLYFTDLHMERLLHSAAVIGITPAFGAAEAGAWLEALVKANALRDSNLKVLLIGAKDGGADFYALQLNPLYPKRHDYRDGALALLFAGERQYPEAKSLNMLVSTMAFRQAQEREAYDAILVNRHGELTEGTRTNLFYTDGAAFYTPPATQVLAGVTRHTVIQCIRERGWSLSERALPLAECRSGAWDGLFLTSTSTKIMPLKRLEAATRSGPPDWEPRDFELPPLLRELSRAYDEWLDAYRQGQPVLVP